MMTTTQVANVTRILTEEMGDCIGHYEISNVIYAMNKTNIGVDNSVDAAKLKEACQAAKTYLKSVTRPLHMIAMESIYNNKVLFAMAKIQSEIK